MILWVANGPVGRLRSFDLDNRETPGALEPGVLFFGCFLAIKADQQNARQHQPHVSCHRTPPEKVPWIEDVYGMQGRTLLRRGRSVKHCVKTLEFHWLDTDTARGRNMATLRGRVAIITGASRGIGRAIALGLARAGCHVVVAAKSTESTEKSCPAPSTA